MNKNMKTNFNQKFAKAAIILLLLVFLVPAFGMAAPGGDWGPRKGHGKRGMHKSPLGIWRNPGLVKTLELTDNQVKALKDADFDLRERRAELKSRITTLRLKMERAFSEAAVDEPAILQLAEKLSKVKGKMYVLKTKARLSVKKILSPEQCEKLKTVRYNDRGKFHGRHGNGKHGRGRHHEAMIRHNM
jgi:Spy/CpxP family protein refolding chaperone